MNLEDFNNIDFKNIGSLSAPVKLVFLFVIALILIGLGYWFLWLGEIDAHEEAKAKEADLRQTFLVKTAQAVKIESYRQQMVDIEKTFGALLKQLPDRSQMDGLLTDINQAGLGRGLEFELFKPGNEVVADFYAEMPIVIRIKGNYHDIGAFATDVSKLSRIVTLNDLSITAASKEAGSGELALDAVAKTYRYLDSSELARKRAEKAEKKKKGAKK
jgi:type IV pilus assembly protein PilO